MKAEKEVEYHFMVSILLHLRNDPFQRDLKFDE